jgi:hypothetical protein
MSGELSHALASELSAAWTRGDTALAKLGVQRTEMSELHIAHASELSAAREQAIVALAALERQRTEMSELHLSDVSELSAAREQATTAVAELERQRAEMTALLAELDGEIECGICSGPISKPATLRCGHQFCALCLARWLQEIYDAHCVRSPGWLEEAHDEKRRLEQRAYANSREIREQLYLFQPDYTCPSCRSLIEDVPDQAHVLRRVCDALAKRRGGNQPLMFYKLFEHLFPFSLYFSL